MTLQPPDALLGLQMMVFIIAFFCILIGVFFTLKGMGYMLDKILSRIYNRVIMSNRGVTGVTPEAEVIINTEKNATTPIKRRRKNKKSIRSKRA